MTKTAWNSLIPSNQKLWLCGAVVSTRLPEAMRFDATGRKVPTPYKLFLEWADKTLSGNWAATAVPEGFVLAVASEEDKARIVNAHGPLRGSSFKIAGRSVSLLSYADGSFAKLAAELGYTFNFSSKGA